MSATYARVTPSLPCGNPNASRMDERPVQLTRTDGHETRTNGHVDNPAGCSTQPAMSENTRELATSLVEMKIASGDLRMPDAGAS